MDLARLTYKCSLDPEDGKACNRAPIASFFSSHLVNPNPQYSFLWLWFVYFCTHEITRAVLSDLSVSLSFTIPDYSRRWMYGGRGKILAHEALLLFWVRGRAGRPALHHEGESTVLLLLLRVPVRRVLRYLRRTHRYWVKFKGTYWLGFYTAFRLICGAF